MLPPDITRLRAAGDPYAFGVLPSPIDLRDKTLPPTAGAVPDTFLHPAARKVPVRNQQGGTCVGNSIATCLSLMEFAETGRVVPFDGELLNARVVDRAGGEWAAASPRDVLDDVLNHGAVAFQGDGGINMYFPKAYATVDHTSADAIQAAISTPQMTVTAACWLLSNFGEGVKTTDAGGHVNETGPGTGYAPDIPGENPWGYHELTFIGYDPQGVLFQNSWGTGWGDGGFGRFAWDYVTSGRVGEMWAVTDNPDTAGGLMRVYVPPSEPNTGRVVRKGTSAAVYLLETGGRIWVQSLAQARQFGIDMHQVISLPADDPVWNSPVIGPDAPMQYQG